MTYDSTSIAVIVAIIIVGLLFGYWTYLWSQVKRKRADDGMALALAALFEYCVVLPVALMGCCIALPFMILKEEMENLQGKQSPSSSMPPPTCPDCHGLLPCPAHGRG